MRLASGHRIIGRLGPLDALVLTALLWFLGKFLRYAFPPLFDSFQLTYNVSTAQLGWAFTAFMLAYAAMQFPSGVLADRLGSVKVIVAGGIVTSVAALTLLFSVPFGVLVVIMVVIGLGTGVHKTVAVRLLSRTYPARTGRVLGIFDTFGTFGGVVAPVAVIAVASLPGPRPGWQTLLFLTGLVGLVFTAAFRYRIPRRLRETAATEAKITGDRRFESATGSHSASPSAPTPGWRSYTALFSDRRFTVFVLATICFGFTYNGVVAFLPLYLTREAGLTAGTAGALYSALFLASLAQLVTGELSDHVGTLPVIVGALCLATAGLAGFILLTGAGPVVLGIAIVCLGLGAHGFRPVRGAYLMETVPEPVAAGGFGMVRTLLMGAGAISPGVVGTLSDSAGFRPAFWLLAASISIATVLTVSLLLTERPADEPQSVH